MLIKSISGIRGIVPSELNASLAARYALAFHAYCDDGDIIIGRDTRRSGGALLSAIIDALVSTGRKVRDCGICPTPTVQFVVEDTDAVGGIVVTASHNPEEWNGLKFINRDGCFLNGDQFQRLISLQDKKYEKSRGNGMYSRFDQAVRRHIQRILLIEWIELDLIKKRRFKVAVDAVNGAASEVLPFLLQRLNCDIVKVNCNLTGQFTRGAEPLPENLEMLTQAVKNNECDVGFATDPDGDRLAVVDETGRPLGEEYTLTLAVDDFLRSAEPSQTIVTNLSTTLAVDKVADNFGATVVRTAVGEINVVQRMKEIGAQLGGEGNGGVIVRDVHLGRDSLVAAVLVLNRMGRTDAPLSTIFAGLPQFHIVKDKVRVAEVHLNEMEDKLTETFKDATINRTDGIKFSWEDRWIHLRKSNTEPIMRIYAEAPAEKEAKELIDRLKSKL